MESEDKEDEDNEMVTPHSYSEDLKLILSDENRSKSDKITDMVKLTKQVNKQIQSSWNKDDENEEHVIIVPGVLSEQQKEKYNQVVDTFAGLTPEESFEMLFNEESKELIISETNRYARTVGNNIMYTLTENML